jgi:hypothetical protein
MIRTLWPYRAHSRAAARPATPAPTIRTEIVESTGGCELLFMVDDSVFARCGIGSDSFSNRAVYIVITGDCGCISNWMKLLTEKDSKHHCIVHGRRSSCTPNSGGSLSIFERRVGPASVPTFHQFFRYAVFYPQSEVSLFPEQMRLASSADTCTVSEEESTESLLYLGLQSYRWEGSKTWMVSSQKPITEDRSSVPAQRHFKMDAWRSSAHAVPDFETDGPA